MILFKYNNLILKKPQYCPGTAGDLCSTAKGDTVNSLKQVICLDCTFQSRDEKEVNHVITRPVSCTTAMNSLTNEAVAMGSPLERRTSDCLLFDKVREKRTDKDISK